MTLCWECWHLCGNDRDILRRLNARGAADELTLVPIDVACSFGWLCKTQGVGNELVSALFHSAEEIA